MKLLRRGEARDARGAADTSLKLAFGDEETDLFRSRSD
jgi:hypothetical protein